MVRKRVAMGMVCLLALALVLIMTGCASTQRVKSDNALMSVIQAGAGAPVVIMSELNADSVKTAEVTHRVWLGWFGVRNWPSIAETAGSGGITKIATVEYYSTPGILGLWVDYTTIVTGN